MRAATARISAGGITCAPTLRKVQKLTFSFSRRIALNQRMVASDPVIERFGPMSTPISTASTTRCGACACTSVELAMSPAGRLLIRLLATAMRPADVDAAPISDCAEAFPERARECADETGAIECFDKNEQTSDQRQHAPRHVFE